MVISICVKQTIHIVTYIKRDICKQNSFKMKPYLVCLFSNVLYLLSFLQLHQFEMVFPIEPYSCVQKRRLLRRLRRKGVGQVELEPENHRINVTTRRSANVILSVLRGVDPNARLLGTFRETLIEDNIDADSVEVVDGL